MPQGTKNVKKVSETNFPQIKAYTAKYGVEKAQEKYGYSTTTLRSIAKADDYPTWRGTRKAKQSRRTPKAEATASAAAVEPQAIQSVVPSQSVTTPEIKKPGHGREFTIPKTTPPAQYVTREEFDRVTGNLSQQINGLKSQLGNIGRDVQSLVKEDAAFTGAEILLADKARKSRWQRIRDGLREGFRS